MLLQVGFMWGSGCFYCHKQFPVLCIWFIIPPIFLMKHEENPLSISLGIVGSRGKSNFMNPQVEEMAAVHTSAGF